MAIYTDADDLDFARLEREAFIRGDSTVAQLAAVALDRTEDVAEMQERIDDLEKRLEDEKQESDDSARIREEETTAAIETLTDLLKSCKRLSNRTEIEEAVQAIYNAATGAA